MGALSLCILSGNSASYGGAACSNALTSCTLSSNSAGWYGGGAYYTTLNDCSVLSNSSAWDGGGTYYGSVSNCKLDGNACSHYGGGAYEGALTNCTLTRNSASFAGGGAEAGTLYNCIVYYNRQQFGSDSINYDRGSLSFCCAAPKPLGVGNIDQSPLFVDIGNGNVRLQTNSPCIDAGFNSYVRSTADLDGRARIVGGRVDMGAYEFQGPGIGEFIAWLQRYGLNGDGSATTQIQTATA